MEENRHVRKSNILVDGRYRFGVNEQKILLTILSKIKISDTEFRPYVVPWSQIKKVTKNKVKSLATLNDACEKLKARTVEVKDGDKKHYFGLLSGWTVDPGRSVEFRIDPCLKESLLGLLETGKFTLYRLECILGLSSAYSIRLYEILKSHEWKGTVEINLNDLRWSLDVGDTHKTFDLFRRKILEKAQADLARHTDIKFTYKKVYVLRNVDSLIFTISPNKKYQTTVASFAARKDKLREGDTVVFDGKEYVIEGDCIRLSDGVMPIGTINKFYQQGRIDKK